MIYKYHMGNIIFSPSSFLLNKTSGSFLLNKTMCSCSYQVVSPMWCAEHLITKTTGKGHIFLSLDEAPSSRKVNLCMTLFLYL
jgi:hypothetical protein